MKKAKREKSIKVILKEKSPFELRQEYYASIILKKTKELLGI